MAEVIFTKPGEMNLLGYIFCSLVERNLATAPGARAFAKMKGTVWVGASDMRITLEFKDQKVYMTVGEQGKAAVRVRGSMDTLLGVSLGKGMVGPVLSGKLKIGGKIWRLLPMLKLLAAEKSS